MFGCRNEPYLPSILIYAIEKYPYENYSELIDVKMSFTPLMQTSKLVHKGMGFFRYQNVNNYQYLIIRRFYYAKVQGAKTQDIIPCCNDLHFCIYPK
jgi:hypothetical protein